MANISRFDPFNSIVDDLFRGYLLQPVAYDAPALKLEVTERNGAYLVSADLPGVKKEEIHVDIDGSKLTLTAEIKREKQVSDGERALHTERSFGKVSRSFTLPQELDEAKAEAKFRDGVLELTLPKKASAARKAITIQ